VQRYYPFGGLRVWNVVLLADSVVVLSGYHYDLFMGRFGACTL